MPGWIKVSSSAGQTWILQVLPTVRCQVTGKAKPDFLAHGYFIRFVGEVSKRGAVEQKVSKLTIFTPSQSRQPGAEADTGLGTSFGPRAGEGKKKEAKPAFGAAADFGGRKEGAGKAGAGEVFDIRGQIVGVSNGRLTLQVPTTLFRQSLRLEVAEDADIDVELDDPLAYTLARKGDQVRIQGRQAMANRGYAEDVDIILAEPLGMPQRDAKKHSAKGAKGKRGADAEDAAEAKSVDDKAEKKDDDGSPKAKKGEAGAKKSASEDDGEATDGAPKKRSKAAATDTSEKPAKKKKKPAKSDDEDT